MEILSTVLTGLLWFICVLIIVVVLLQTGKGGSMAGIFGGGAGPESLLGTRTTNFLVKVTVVLCLMFLVICLTLGVLGKQTVGRFKYQADQQETTTGPGTGGAVNPLDAEE